MEKEIMIERINSAQQIFEHDTLPAPKSEIGKHMDFDYQNKVNPSLNSLQCLKPPKPPLQNQGREKCFLQADKNIDSNLPSIQTSELEQQQDKIYSLVEFTPQDSMPEANEGERGEDYKSNSQFSLTVPQI